MCHKVVIIQEHESPVLWISPMIGHLGDTVAASLLTILFFLSVANSCLKIVKSFKGSFKSGMTLNQRCKNFCNNYNNYISGSTCGMIGQFCGLYFTVWSAKLEKSFFSEHPINLKDVINILLILFSWLVL